MKHSPYQQAFYEAVQSTNDNIMLQACPGSGKTTTGLEVMKFIPRYKKTAFLAFSKAIQLELASRVPEHVECMTMHSAGYKAIYNHFKRPLKVDALKTFKVAEPFVKNIKTKDGKDLTDKDSYSARFTISDMLDMARTTLRTSTKEEFLTVEKEFDFVGKNGESNIAWDVLMHLNKRNKAYGKNYFIDYTDMVYLPLYMKLELPQYDYILIDEAQDLSAAQVELISRMKKANGRIIAIGDELQSIYGFAGALTDSMQKIKERFNMKPMPLSITYRVPTAGVELLKEINPLVEPQSDAQEGIIREGSLSDAQEGDLVICRNTKPLISAYFYLLGQEKKSTIVGSEMEKGLDRLIGSVAQLSVEGAQYRFGQELSELSELLISQGISEPKKHWKYQSLNERIEIANIFLEKYRSPALAQQKIHEVFAPDKKAIQLMTVHKSKGLEADRVFFITHYDDVQLIPSKYAITDEQKKQERNLKYVALSRFKKEMIFVRL